MASSRRVIVVDDLSAGLESNVPSGIPIVRVDLATADAVAAVTEGHPDWVIYCAAQTSCRFRSSIPSETPGRTSSAAST